MAQNPIQGQPEPQTQVPNVRLAHGQTPITTDGVVNIGGTPSMFLPSEEQQRKGFWVSHPVVLIHQYSPRYKFAINTESFAAQGQPKLVVIPKGTGVSPVPEEDPIDRLDALAGSDEEYNGGETHAEKV